MFIIEILKAILFGIVEGITEWLPISSTGHMILLDEFVKLQVSEAFYEMFQVVIQLGAIAAVLLLFFHKLNPFSPKKDQTQKQQADDCRGQHRHDHLQPQIPGVLLLGITLFGSEGVQLMEEQHQHRSDGAQLNHHLEHLVKAIGYF